MLLPDRYDSHLLRRKPEGETSLKVLYNNPDESFQGAINCTVQHNRHLLLALRILEGTTEVVRKLEVKLYCSALPLSSESILYLQVDFRTIEGTITLIDFKTAFPVFIGQNLL